VPLHILIVDDEPAIRLLCRVNLQADGMTVDEAWDSASAIVAARARVPDAVLLDVMLPGDDGFAVAASLREVPGLESVPIMLLTARADLDGSELVRRSGAAGVLTKPFNPVDLSERLRALARP
jgi:two-component system, OmpR family, response regulator